MPTRSPRDESSTSPRVGGRPSALALIRRLRATQLGGFASDTLYVAAWVAVGSVADLLQITLLIRAVGLSEYGRFALVVAFVTLVGQFFDVRMTTATTAFAADRLEQRDVQGAAAIFRFSYRVDLTLGLFGFAMVLALAPVFGSRLAGGQGYSLMVLYGMGLIVSSLDDTSIAILRVLDRFRLAAVCGIAAELVRVALVGTTLAFAHSLVPVVAALLVAFAVRALLNLAGASRAARTSSPQATLVRGQSVSRGVARSMLSMVLHTNMFSYSRLAMAQLPTLLVGAIAGAAQVGVYKAGMAVAAGVGRLGDPAMSAIFPRLAKLRNSGAYDEIKQLLRRTTAIAGAVFALALSILLVFKSEISHLIAGSPVPAALGSVVVVASVAQAINGIFFWNAQLLFSMSRSRVVGFVSIVGAVLQIAVLLILVPSLGARGAAVAFLIAYIFVNLSLTLIAIRALRNTSSVDEPRAADEAGSEGSSSPRAVLR